jgi:hypothetical protein
MSLSLLTLLALFTSIMNSCNLLALKLPKMEEEVLLTQRSLSFSGLGRERLLILVAYMDIQSIQKGQCCIKVNMLQLTVG